MYGPGTSTRLRRLESEREQLAGHVRALADLLSVNGARPVQVDRRQTGANGSDLVAAVRDRAVRAAHEQAERDLEQLLADTAG